MSKKVELKDKTANGTKPVLAEVPCPKCDGYGWYADHSPHPHPDGDCCGECPIQVQCENCEATGKVSV
jgi:hypothetical protein